MVQTLSSQNASITRRVKSKFDVEPRRSWYSSYLASSSRSSRRCPRERAAHKQTSGLRPCTSTETAGESRWKRNELKVGTPSLARQRSSRRLDLRSINSKRFKGR
ncbi:hypothetical protein BDZ89DRAFT_1057628 [Hymenopellis radicata]|nr:hypothetical protein BDZ89DRAFT_1057617 [Hymenopellis radicata]KAF9049270.1 hypothetical protein BDZ89DRAFT_1057628 [Hymenopellis radicata]